MGGVIFLCMFLGHTYASLLSSPLPQWQLSPWQPGLCPQLVACPAGLLTRGGGGAGVRIRRGIWSIRVFAVRHQFIPPHPDWPGLCLTTEGVSCACSPAGHRLWPQGPRPMAL